MNFLKNLFSSKDKAIQPTQYSVGDIFYTSVNGKYYLNKMLVIETDFDCYHVLSFGPIYHRPKIKDIENLKVIVYHAPFDRKVFRDGTILTNRNVTSDDLIGYHEYLRQTYNPEEYLNLADKYYQTALKLTDENKHSEAIDAYSKAIDLVPSFFEAIDNRAFCKMNKDMWTEAIKDFENSLIVNPDSFLVEFSIGECYIKLQDYEKAKIQFEKAHQIDPKHEAPIKFLTIVNKQLHK